MAFVNHQARKLDEKTKVSGEQWITILDQAAMLEQQSVTIEKQSKVIEQLREENKVGINKFFYQQSRIWSIFSSGLELPGGLSNN